MQRVAHADDAQRADVAAAARASRTVVRVAITWRDDRYLASLGKTARADIRIGDADVDLVEQALSNHVCEARARGVAVREVAEIGDDDRPNARCVGFGLSSDPHPTNDVRVEPSATDVL